MTGRMLLLPVRLLKGERLFRNGRLCFWLLVACLAVATTAAAQSVGSLSPGAIQKRSQETLEYYQLEKKLERPPEEKAQVQSLPAEPDKGGEGVTAASFLLRKVMVNPSAILPAEAVAAVVSAYEGREVTIDDLNRLVDELNRLYAERRVVTARAFLLPQNVAEGVVEIRLVESRLGKVIIEGNQDTSTGYITGQFSLEPGMLLTLDQLEGELRRFNRLNDVLAKAELRRGEAPLTTDCILRITEPITPALVFYGDNTGEEETGEARAGFFLTVRSLFGRRDPLTIGASASEGSRAMSLAYELPVHSSGTRLGIGVSLDTMEIIDGQLEPLEITGESSTYDLNLSQPLLVGPETQVDLRGGFQWKKSTTSFDDVTLFETKVRSLYAGLDYQWRGEDGVFLGKGEVAHGFDAFGGDSRFLKGNLDLAYQTRLPFGFALLLRGNGQIADSHPLPSMEQFQIGGMATVRGYHEGARIGDDGYFVSAELHAPLPNWQVAGLPLNEMANGVVFVDNGWTSVQEASNENNRDNVLTSVGVGLVFSFSQYLEGRISLGIPLDNRDEDQDRVIPHLLLKTTIF